MPRKRPGGASLPSGAVARRLGTRRDGPCPPRWGSERATRNGERISEVPPTRDYSAVRFPDAALHGGHVTHLAAGAGALGAGLLLLSGSRRLLVAGFVALATAEAALLVRAGTGAEVLGLLGSARRLVAA